MLRILFLLLVFSLPIFSARYSNTMILGDVEIHSGPISGPQDELRFGYSGIETSTASISFSGAAKFVFVSNNSNLNLSSPKQLSTGFDPVLGQQTYNFMVGGLSNNGNVSNIVGFDNQKTIKAFSTWGPYNTVGGNFMFLHAYKHSSQYLLNQGGPLYIINDSSGPLLQTLNVDKSGLSQVHVALGVGLGTDQPRVPLVVSVNNLALENAKFQARPYLRLYPNLLRNLVVFNLPAAIFDSVNNRSIYEEAFLVLRGQAKFGLSNVNINAGNTIFQNTFIANQPFFLTQNISLNASSEISISTERNNFDYIFLELYPSGNPTFSEVVPKQLDSRDVMAFSFTDRERMGLSKSGFSIRKPSNPTPSLLFHIENSGNSYPDIHVFDVSENAQTVDDFKNALLKERYAHFDRNYFTLLLSELSKNGAIVPSQTVTHFEASQTVGSRGFFFGAATSEPDISFKELSPTSLVLQNFEQYPNIRAMGDGFVAVSHNVWINWQTGVSTNRNTFYDPFSRGVNLPLDHQNYANALSVSGDMLITANSLSQSERNYHLGFVVTESILHEAKILTSSQDGWQDLHVVDLSMLPPLPPEMEWDIFVIGTATLMSKRSPQDLDNPLEFMETTQFGVTFNSMRDYLWNESIPSIGGVSYDIKVRIPYFSTDFSYPDTLNASYLKTKDVDLHLAKTGRAQFKTSVTYNSNLYNNNLDTDGSIKIGFGDIDALSTDDAVAQFNDLNVIKESLFTGSSFSPVDSTTVYDVYQKEANRPFYFSYGNKGLADSKTQYFIEPWRPTSNPVVYTVLQRAIWRSYERYFASDYFSTGDTFTDRKACQVHMTLSLGNQVPSNEDVVSHIFNYASGSPYEHTLVTMKHFSVPGNFQSSQYGQLKLKWKIDGRRVDILSKMRSFKGLISSTSDNDHYSDAVVLCTSGNEIFTDKDFIASFPPHLDGKRATYSQSFRDYYSGPSLEINHNTELIKREFILEDEMGRIGETNALYVRSPESLEYGIRHSVPFLGAQSFNLNPRRRIETTPFLGGGSKRMFTYTQQGWGARYWNEDVLINKTNGQDAGEYQDYISYVYGINEPKKSHFQNKDDSLSLTYKQIANKRGLQLYSAVSRFNEEYVAERVLQVQETDLDTLLSFTPKQRGHAHSIAKNTNQYASYIFQNADPFSSLKLRHRHDFLFDNYLRFSSYYAGVSNSSNKPFPIVAQRVVLPFNLVDSPNKDVFGFFPADSNVSLLESEFLPYLVYVDSANNSKFSNIGFGITDNSTLATIVSTETPVEIHDYARYFANHPDQLLYSFFNPAYDVVTDILESEHQQAARVVAFQHAVDQANTHDFRSSDLHEDIQNNIFENVGYFHDSRNAGKGSVNNDGASIFAHQNSGSILSESIEKGANYAMLQSYDPLNRYNNDNPLNRIRLLTEKFYDHEDDGNGLTQSPKETFNRFLKHKLFPELYNGQGVLQRPNTQGAKIIIVAMPRMKTIP